MFCGSCFVALATNGISVYPRPVSGQGAELVRAKVSKGGMAIIVNGRATAWRFASDPLDRLSGMESPWHRMETRRLPLRSDAMRQLNGFKPCNESKVRDDELRSPRKGPFSPSSGEKVAEGRMRGFSLTCHLETIPLTLALSPRTVVNLLRNSFAGRGDKSQLTSTPQFTPREEYSSAAAE